MGAKVRNTSDIKAGMIIQLRDGNYYIVCQYGNDGLSLYSIQYMDIFATMDNYNGHFEIKYGLKTKGRFDIVRVLFPMKFRSIAMLKINPKMEDSEIGSLFDVLYDERIANSSHNVGLNDVNISGNDTQLKSGDLIICRNSYKDDWTLDKFLFVSDRYYVGENGVWKEIRKYMNK